MCAANATPSGVSRVWVTQTSLQECDIGLHRTVTVDSHRQHMDTSYKSPAPTSLEWTCFLLPLTKVYNHWEGVVTAQAEACDCREEWCWTQPEAHNYWVVWCWAQAEAHHCQEVC